MKSSATDTTIPNYWRKSITDNEIIRVFKLIWGDLIPEALDLMTRQKAKIERLEKFKSYFDKLYGDGLEVANWHMNGDLEPFDNFYESALDV